MGIAVILRQLNEARIVELISSIYEAGIHFSKWKDALENIVEAHDGLSAALTGSELERSDGWTVTARVEETFLNRYRQHYHTVNPIWRLSEDSPLGAVQTDSMVMPRIDFEQTEFFNDFLKPQRIASMLGTTVEAGRSRRTVLSVHTSGDILDEQIALQNLLFPHIRRAVEINRTLAAGEINKRLSSAMLENLDRGVLVVDEHAKILRVSPRAESMLLKGELRSRDGVLLARCRRSTEQLNKAIRALAICEEVDQPPPLISLSFENDYALLEGLVAPLTCDVPWFVVDRPVALVIVCERNPHRSIAASKLIEKFDLTPAEAKFAIEIVKGDGIPATSKRLEISSTTARTHLFRIFGKTGAHRQAELVQLLLRHSD